jgi:hypothetical protein
MFRMIDYFSSNKNQFDYYQQCDNNNNTLPMQQFTTIGYDSYRFGGINIPTPPPQQQQQQQIESNYPYFSSNLINHGQQQQLFFENNQEKKNKKKCKVKEKKTKRRHESKKSHSFDSGTNLSCNTLTSDDDSTAEEQQLHASNNKKNVFSSTYIKKFEESSLHNVFQNILMPGIIKNSSKSSENTTNNSNDSSKSNTIESAKTSNSIKTLRKNFSLRKLAGKITSGAGVLKDRLNNKRNSNTSEKIVTNKSVFYSEIITDVEINKKKPSFSDSSSSSEEYEELNSALSVTNFNFSEKSSINLNDVEPETYYSQHDFDFWFEEDEKYKQIVDDIVYEEVDFENVVDVSVEIVFYK